jgi:hypothetical protein
MRPNREQKKKETVDFLTWCINILQPFLMTQGKTLSIDELKKAVAQFGQNPDTFIVDLQQMGVPPMGQGGPLDQLPPEIINRVKTDPRLQERIKNDPLIK